MTRIVLLNEELGTQMQIYLALCDAYKIEIAENTESVMYLLRKTRPEILLLDYNLEQFRTNGKTGMDFVRKVKRKYEHLKVMMILGSEDKLHDAAAESSVVDGVVYKPIKNRNLLANLKKMTVEPELTT